MNQTKAKRWLDRQLWDTDREEGPVVRLVVKHLDGNGKPGRIEIWSCKIPTTENSVTVPEEQIPELLADIETTCHDDAEGMSAGMQRYALQCFVRDKGTPHARFTFSVSAGADDEDDGGPSEPANAKGLQAQLMRHNEALMRTTVMSVNQNMQMMSRTISSQNEHIERLLEDKRETFDMVENLKSKQQERDLALMEATNKEERYQELFGNASLLLPTVVNRIAGRKLLPETVSPMQDMLKRFAESITEEQLMTMNLAPAQRVALLEFMEASQEEDASKQSQLPKANN